MSNIGRGLNKQKNIEMNHQNYSPVLTRKIWDIWGINERRMENKRKK